MSDDLQAAINTVTQEITLSNGRVIPNRFLKSAMTERLCTWGEDLQERGKPTPEYIRLYEQWGKGKLGVCVLGNLPCDARYPEAVHNACIDPKSNWDQVAAFKPVIKGAKGPDGKTIVIGQVTHAGRQTANHVTKEPISSSDVQSPPLGGMEFEKPRPATIEEIEDIVKRFGFAAKVLYDGGADGVQLHCAHGYLLSQFLSPRVNHRTDKYGGSLENRSRILFEILDEVKKQVPDEKFIRSIKINSADFSEGGFSEEESRETCQKLEAAGMHLIELSGGTYESLAFNHIKESTKKREAFFIEFAERIRPHLKSAKLCVTGGFRSVLMMAKAINEGSCDIVGIARPLTAELDLPARLMSGKQNKAADNHIDQAVSLPASYLQLYEAGQGKAPSDLSNPEVAKRVQEAIQKDPARAMRLQPLLHKEY